jgi:hypothetical protein
MPKISESAFKRSLTMTEETNGENASDGSKKESGATLFVANYTPRSRVGG